MERLEKKEINLYLSHGQHKQIARLRQTGVNMSAIARLAIRKFANTSLDPDTDDPKSKRVLLYLDAESFKELDTLAEKEGTTRSDVLRRLIAQYLRVNKDALASLF